MKLFSISKKTEGMIIPNVILAVLYNSDREYYSLWLTPPFYKKTKELVNPDTFEVETVKAKPRLTIGLNHGKFFHHTFWIR